MVKTSITCIQAPWVHHNCCGVSTYAMAYRHKKTFQILEAARTSELLVLLMVATTMPRSALDSKAPHGHAKEVSTTVATFRGGHRSQN